VVGSCLVVLAGFPHRGLAGVENLGLPIVARHDRLTVEYHQDLSPDGGMPTDHPAGTKSRGNDMGLPTGCDGGHGEGVAVEVGDRVARQSVELEDAHPGSLPQTVDSQSIDHRRTSYYSM
jgi:hypothetical protein